MSHKDRQPRLSRRQRDELGKGVLKATGVAWIVAAAKASAVGATGVSPVGVAAVGVLIARGIQKLGNAIERDKFIANLRGQGATEEEVEKIMSVLERDEF